MAAGQAETAHPRVEAKGRKLHVCRTLKASARTVSEKSEGALLETCDVGKARRPTMPVPVSRRVGWYG